MKLMHMYVNKDGQQYGPYTVEQLRQYVQQGYFTTADHACFDGQNWVTVGQVLQVSSRSQAASPQLHPARDSQENVNDPKKSKLALWCAISLSFSVLVVSVTLFGL